MSKAFTKEDVDPPERSGRARSASGLPPGATNYITAGGAARLRQELASLRRADGDHGKRIVELERIVGSVTIVDLPMEPGPEVGFGARVTVCDSAKRSRIFRILGVDELDADPDAVSWISPLGRALLAARLNDLVTTTEIGSATIVKIEYPADWST